MLEVQKLPPEAHEFRHPVEEAESLFGKDRVVTITKKADQP